MATLEPTVTKQGKESEVDRGLLKIALFGLFGAAASFFTVYLFTVLLSSFTLANVLYALLAVSSFLILAVLQAFFVKSGVKLFAVCLLEALAAGAMFWQQFYPAPSIPLSFGLGVFLVVLFFGAYEGARFLRDALSIRFAFVSRGVFARAATGLFIFLSVVTYVWYFDLGKFNPENEYKLMAAAVSSAEPALRVWFPGASLNQTADEFFRKVAESELRKLSKARIATGGTDAQIDFNILNKQQQEQAIQVAAETLRTSFGAALGAPVSGDMLMKDVFFEFMKVKVAGFSKETRGYFDILVAVMVFFFLKGTFMILGCFIRFIAFVIYKLLLALGFAYVSVETRNREFILLS